MKNIYSLLIVLLFAGLGFVNAQTGPGGVGELDGNGTLKAWYKADAGVTFDGSNKISNWQNTVNVANLDIAATGSLMPDYVASGLNAKPVVSFTGSNRLITSVKLSSSYFPTDAATVFIVANADNTTQQSIIYGTDPVEAQRFSCHLPWSSNYYFDMGGSSGTARINGAFGSAGSFDIWSYSANSASGKTVHKNNNSINSSSGVQTYSSHSSHDFQIGDAYEGDIAEIILFKERINSVRRNIIANYLGAKYNIALTTNDLYAEANYSYNVAGIGQESDGNHLESSSAGFYIKSNGALDNGDYVMFGHDNSANSNSISDLPTGVEARWAKDWYVEKTGAQNVIIKFDMPEGISGDYPQNISNYVLLYRSSTSGNYAEVTATVNYGDADQVAFDVTNANLSNGYYTLGTTDQTNSPVEGAPETTWYTLVSGNWNDWNTWTLDPSGSLPNNPDQDYPQEVTDNVVIKSGKTVTMNISSLHCISIKVDGRLDLGITTGHTFDNISGTGRILMAADNFPSYTDYSEFVDAGEDEGTVVYYGSSSYSLNTSYTFYKMEVDMDAGQTVTLLKDYTLNGDLTITQGTLKINDNSATTNLNLTVKGDVYVETTGLIHTGSANARHQFNFYGDFTNKGEVEFTNRSAAVYDTEATDGIVDANFLNDSKNQSISCEGITNFYRIEIDKGIDATYVLNIDATDIANFKLYGYSNSSSNMSNAMGIIAGSVRIGSNVELPVLAYVSNYSIPAASRLWVDGGSVKKNSGNAIELYGVLEVSDGLLEADVTNGITFNDNALLKVSGGELNTRIIMTSTGGAGNIGGYYQSGGTVNIVSGSTISTYYHFSLTYPDNTFSMSGGTLHVYDANGTNANQGGIFIASSAENINVTGGTVIAEIATNSNPFKITSTAPFYNLILRNTNDATTDHTLDAGTNINGNSDADLAAQPLVVLNDLTIEVDGSNESTLTTNNKDVTIGRNFSIEEGATYDYGTNTTIFNGTEDGELYIGHATADGYEQHFHNFTVNKSADKSITITGDTEKTAAYIEANHSNHDGWPVLVDIDNALTIEKGIFSQGEHAVRLFGDITVKAQGQCGVYEHNTTNLYALIMLKDENFTIETENGAVFGNMKIGATNHTITLTSDVYMKRLSFYHGNFDLKTYNLKLDYLHDELTYNNFDIIDGGITGNSGAFITTGKASDGGLSILITGDDTYGFPIAVSGKYTPAEVIVTVFNDDGYIQIRPVDGELKTTNLSGGDLLSYYWRIGHEDFTTNPTVKYQFEYNNGDIVGAENGYYPGKVLDEDPYTRSYEQQGNLSASSNTITFDDTGGTSGNTTNGFTLENANYTAGVTGRFTGQVDQYYAYWEVSGQGAWPASYSDWNVATTWEKGSIGSGVNEVPITGSVCHIGGRKRVWGETMVNEPAEIRFEHNYTDYPTPDGNNVPRLQFKEPGAFALGRVSGTGMLSFDARDAITVTGDFGDFGNNNESYILYFGSGDNTLTNIPTPIPNLYLEAGTKRIGEAITVNNDFILNQTCLIYLENDIDIARDLVIGDYGAGDITFPATGLAVTVTVGRNIDFTRMSNSNDRDLNVQNGGDGSIEHKLILKGSILHSNQAGNDLDFYNGNNRTKVILELQGESNESYSRTSTSVPSLYRIIMNKGADQINSFTFSDDVTLSGATSGAGVDKALELQNGTLILDDTDISFNLTTGDDDFTIPASAALEVKQGTVYASGNSGILLDGKLIVNGGTVDMSGGDNYIRYSSSGNATIEVESGTLKVGSQIRRGSTSTEGVLTYIQSGGTVEIGQSAAGTASRGIFEIVNAGSSITHSGGSFTLVNDLRTNPTIASMYFKPETVNLSAGTTITFGNSNTSSSGDSFTLYAGEDLQNLTVNNTDTKLTLSVVPCTINENINIGSGTEFDANGLVLTTKGDFTNSGTYTANGNDIYFSGTADQTITGVTSFYNLYKNSSNKLILASDVTVTNELHLESGTFDDGDNDLFVQGDMYIDISTLSGASSDGIVANGTSQQNLVGTSSLAKFKTDNANGIFVPTGNEITITGELKMNKGIFDIGQNLLILTKVADVIEVSSFSESNMVQTNISFTDAGIKKYFPVISSATEFTYPMGSGGKYTPVTLNITNSTNDDTYIRVKAANETHPSVTPPDGDPDNVLSYYWILDADGASGFAGTAVMQAYSGDVQLTGSNSAADYITARLLSRASGTWDKYLPDDFEEGTSELTFTFTNTDDAGIDGDYTAGLDAAIPDQVALYTSTKNGEWTDQTVWSPQSPAGGPRGARVLVKHAVTIPANYIVSYASEIDNGGELKVNSSFGHRLGNVSGTGILYMERGDMPAGDYTELFTASGGTVEYGGTTDYDILSEMPEVNNIIVSGTGDRRLPNIEVQLLGDLTINGPDLINEQVQKLNVKKDINYTSGTYTAKTGANAVVNMNGSSRQTIYGPGSFTGTNSFYNFEINNTTGVTLNTPIEIDNNMYFSDGVIFSTSANTITITNYSNTCVTGGKSTSYVEGPLQKAINNSDYFVFPVGDALRYGEIKVSVEASSGGTWEAQYYNHSPGDDSMDPASLSGDIDYVSHNEYWRVEAPTTGDKANLLMRWDSNSGVNPNTDFRVTKWTALAPDAWAEVTIGTKTGTSSSGTTDLASNLTFGFDGSDNSHYITFGTISIPVYMWDGSSSTDWFTTANWSGGIIPDASSDVTIDNVTNDPVIDNSGAVQVNGLIINSGATLTLQPGAQMTINGNLTTNSGLTIQNTVASPTSLINKGTVTGHVSVEWTYPDSRYMYVGHSVDGVTYTDYTDDITASNLFLYDYPGGWHRLTSDTDLDGAEHALEGYAVKSKEGSDVTVDYSGLLRYGTYSSTFNGYQLIGNPYQSYMDVEDVGFDVGNALLPTIWTSSNVSGELVFATYNTSIGVGANEGTRYIAPGQSFWVSNSSSSLLSIDPTVRVHATGVLKSGSMAPGDILRITLTNEGLSDEVVLVFRPEGAIEVTNSDSHKRMGSCVEVPNIYTLKDADKLVIGMFPDGGEVDSINLGYKFSKAKEITFKATNIDEFNVEDKVYLMDKLTNITVDLRKTPEYTFTSTKEEDDNRFVLIFEQVSTDIDELGNGSSEDSKVLIYSSGARAIIKVDKDLLNQTVGEGLISIYTTNGELVSETKLIDIRTEIDLPGYRGVYIVEVRMNSLIVTGKVIKTE